MVEIKDREVRICKATGWRVVMEYVPGTISANGNPDWLCLHNAGEDEDEEAVKQFLLDQENR